LFRQRALSEWRLLPVRVFFAVHVQLASQDEEFAVGGGEGGLQLCHFFAVFAAVGGELLGEAADQGAGGGLGVGVVGGFVGGGIAACSAQGLDLCAQDGVAVDEVGGDAGGASPL
jgi:hypothetical protein